MKKGVVMTLPTSDEVTNYLFYFSKPLEKEALRRGIKIKTIEGENVTRKSFEQSITKLNPSFVILNGHGAENLICGHKDNVLIKLGVNENLLEGRLTYARSCWAAAKLGKKAVSKKGCFIGYSIPFMFLHDKTRIGNPLKDKTAKIFFDTSNLVALGLFKGNRASKANTNSKKSMLKAINKLLKEPTKETNAIATTLWNNYRGQVVHGDKEMCV